MATNNAQRMGILIILVVMVVGTIGSFAVMILSQQNQTNEAARLQKIEADYNAQYEEYRKKVDEQAVELSGKYHETFKSYESRVGEFNRDDVDGIKTEDLAIGEGEEIGDDTVFAAYYIGWNPNGKIFDQSLDGDRLKAPLLVESGLKQASLIEGWKEGMRGMKIGGVREITIPSDKAYGEQGQGDDIPPNTPLKFIVMAIEEPETINQPEIPTELYQGAGIY